MYEKEKEIIDKMSKEKKAKTWAQLNSYRVPKQLKHIKKEVKIEFKKGIKEFTGQSIVSQLMRYIEETVTDKETSYAWWKLQKLGVENHEEWYKKNYGI